MDLEPGIPSKRESSTHADYVPALNQCISEPPAPVYKGLNAARNGQQVLKVLQGNTVKCGESLKLHLPSQRGNALVARAMTSGTVTTMEMTSDGKWVIRSQVLRLTADTDAVHRLDVGGWLKPLKI